MKILKGAAAFSLVAALVVGTCINIYATPDDGGSDILTSKLQSQEVTDYIRNMSFDKDKVLSIDLEPSVEKDFEGNSETKIDESQLAQGKIIITKKELKDYSDSDVEMDNIVANASAIYPGAVVLADQELLSGSPTEFYTSSRTPVPITLTLNGAQSEASFTVEDPRSSGNVMSQLNAAVAAWAEKGYATTAMIESEVIEASDTSMLDAKLGITGAAKKLGIDTSVKLSEEKNRYVVKFKQVYFTARVETGQYSNADVFGAETTVDELKSACESEAGKVAPPLLIDKVNYGRTIYFILETTKNEKDIEESFKFDGGSTSASQSAKINDVCKNSSITCRIFGGNAEHITNIKSADDINKIITADISLKDATQSAFFPVSYSTVFLKDMKEAKTFRTTQYISKESTTRKDSKVELSQNGVYIVKEWYVKAKPITGVNEDGSFTYGDTKTLYSDTYIWEYNTRTVTVPANYGKVEFGYDITWGTDWPYKGVITEAPFGKATIEVSGGCRTPKCTIKIDGKKVTEQ